MMTEFESVLPSVIPEGWSLKKVGQLADLTAGGTPSTGIPEYWGGDIPWMSSGEVNLGRITNVEGRITELGFRNCSAKMIPVNSVFMALAGQGKTRGKVAYNEIELCTNQSLAAIMPSKGLDYKFLFYNLESRYEEIRAMSSGDGGRGGLNLTIIKSIQLLIPSLAEQQKIAEILSTVDEKLAVMDEQLAQTQELKKGLIQHLLTKGIGHTAFKDSPLGQIPESWEVSLLDSVAKRGSGHTPSKSFPEYYDGDIKWVSLGDSHRLDNRWIKETKTSISVLGIRNSSAVLHPKGSVLLSRDAGVGKSAVMHEEMAVSQHFITWNCGSRLNNWFLYYILQHNKSFFERIAAGSTIKTIGLPFFKKFMIPVPPINEQELIAEILNTIDDKLLVLTDKKTQYQELKRGLMQQLLTGQRRVKLSNEESILA